MAKVSLKTRKARKSPRPKRPGDVVKHRANRTPPHRGASRPERKRPGVMFAGHAFHARKRPPGIRSWRIADRLEAHREATRSLGSGIEGMIRAASRARPSLGERRLRRKAA